MKRNIFLFGAICMLSALVSCEYFGSFRFIINNNTDEEMTVTYRPQLRTYEDVLPTYRHGDDYDYFRLADNDTTIIVKSHQQLDLELEVGMVDRDFPTESDTPESWGILPMWKLISCIVVGGDTIDCMNYAQEKWIRRGSEYTLDIGN